MPLNSLDPRGEFRIEVKEASCPGCGKGAVYWGFEDGGADEWFLVQRVCTTMHVTECKKQGDGCCKPDVPKVCRSCIYEKIPMRDGRGHDRWKLPWSIPKDMCGTFGFGTTTAEIRSFDIDVDDNDQWRPAGTKDFCDFPDINVGEHRMEAPTYWANSSGSYSSYMLHGWDCCTKAKSTGFLAYSTTGIFPRFKTCGDGTPPRRQGQIPW